MAVNAKTQSCDGASCGHLFLLYSFEESAPALIFVGLAYYYYYSVKPAFVTQSDVRSWQARGW